MRHVRDGVESVDTMTYFTPKDIALLFLIQLGG